MPSVKLTKQQRQPHARLVECRNRVEKAGYPRVEAAALCNGLTDEQVDELLKAPQDALTKESIAEFLADSEAPAESEAPEEKKEKKAKKPKSEPAKEETKTEDPPK